MDSSIPNFEDVSTDELIRLISPSSAAHKELQNREVLRSSNIVGELGEYYAKKFYGQISGYPSLQLAPPSVRNVDALSREGNRYSIKCICTKDGRGTTGAFWGLEPPGSEQEDEQVFEYLVIVILDKSYAVNKILQLTWSDFIEHKNWNSRMRNWNLSITNRLVDSVKIVYQRSI